MLKSIKRKGPSPVKPLKLAKQVAREKTIDEIVEEEPEKREPNITSQQVSTNPTVLSKQIKIVTQINAK